MLRCPCWYRPLVLQDRRAVRRSHRVAFTLVEMLVSITILVILATLAIAAFRDTKRDKIAAAARQMSATVNGARSRAGKSVEPRGVRLLRDRQDPTLISGLQYVGQATLYDGAVRVQINRDGNVQLKLPSFQAGEWLNLRNEGLLKPGSRIRIPANESGRWYTVSTQNFDPANNKMRIVGLMDNAFWNPLVNSGSGAYQIHPIAAEDTAEVGFSNTLPIPYLMRLAPHELPETEPTNLPPGAVIDLASSRIPLHWYVFEDTNQNGVLDANENDGNATLPNDNANGILDDVTFDIPVTPNGSITGPLTGTGPIFLYVCARDDIDRMRSMAGYLPGRISGDFENGTTAPYGPDHPSSDRRLVCIIPQTGLVYIANVNGADVLNNATLAAGADGWADDPFSFARLGREGR